MEDVTRWRTTVNVLLWQLGDAVLTAALLTCVLALTLACYRLWLHRQEEK